MKQFAVVNRTILVLWSVAISAIVNAKQPYGGTVWIEPDIFTTEDPTEFVGLEYINVTQDEKFYSHNLRIFTSPDIYLFHATYADHGEIRISVLQEDYTFDEAKEQAEFHSEVVGRVPLIFRQGIEEIEISIGTERCCFSANSDLQTIHVPTAYVQQLENRDDGYFLEEVYMHEAAHTSIDNSVEHLEVWQQAQKLDPDFISEYAWYNPRTEDVAESVTVWYAVRYLSDRISETDTKIIEETIPNRLNVFDHIFDGADLSPVIIEKLPVYVISTFDDTSGILSIPKMEFEEQNYEIELELIDADQIIFRLRSWTILDD